MADLLPLFCVFHYLHSHITYQKKLIRRLIYFIIAEYLGKPKVLIDVNSPGTTVDFSSNEQGCRKWVRCPGGGQLLALQLPGALAKSMSESNKETIQETTSKESNLTQFQKKIKKTNFQSEIKDTPTLGSWWSKSVDVCTAGGCGMAPPVRQKRQMICVSWVTWWDPSLS